MKYATKQEIFDAAVRGLASQEYARSATDPQDDDPMCLYNGPGGIHCAVGWLIEGAAISEEENGDRLNRLLAKRPDIAEMFDGAFGDWCARDEFLRQLQLCHDICNFEPSYSRSHVFEPTPEHMRAALRKFAEHHGLSASALDA